MSDFTNFRAVFDELTDDVQRSRHQFFIEHLRNWLDVIDETPDAQIIVERTQRGLDVADFLAKSKQTIGSMVGSGRLEWPRDKEQRLGMKLLVFREMAEGRLDPLEFSFDYTYADNDFDRNISELVGQVFTPMARELRRFLESEVAKKENLLEVMQKAAIPASDRIVTVDHNSPRYKEVMTALENLERAIKESNLYEDPQEKEMHVAEVSAGRRILQATMVRVATVVTGLGGTLLYVAKKFVDSGLGKAAGATWDLITSLIGHLM